MISLAIGLGAWLAVAMALSALPVSPAYAMAAALSAVAFGQTFLPRSQAVAKSAPMTGNDLICRMAAGAILTVIVTTLASVMGPRWSGLLAVFPLLGIVLSVASHRAHGPDFVISLLRGMVLGRFSFVAFCLCLTVALPRQAVTVAFVEAGIAAMLVQGAIKSGIPFSPPDATARSAARRGRSLRRWWR